MSWTAAEAERHLEGLAPVGWKLGLDRIRLLTTALGLPQHRYASIHVVGTNGKSSVTRMTAALIEAAGLRAGACVSPHEGRWSERVLIGGSEIDPALFAEAVEEAATAAQSIERSLEEGEAVTQFELSVAASFLALARARVQVAVVEAGLGGRLDATNVLPSRATVLTSVGLDHTAWLGDNELQIAAEKLAVLRDGSVLVIGALSDSVRELALATADERGARVVQAPQDPGEQIQLAAPGPYQRRNFAVARAAAEVISGDLDDGLVAEVASQTTVPGRLELIRTDPSVYIDAAHNPDGMRALAEAVPEVAGERPVFVCVAAMADKDAVAMIAALAPVATIVVCTEPPEGVAASSRPDARAHAAGELARICDVAGVRAETEPDSSRALARVVELANERCGVAVVTGTHYLLGQARGLASVRRLA